MSGKKEQGHTKKEQVFVFPKECMTIALFGGFYRVGGWEKTKRGGWCLSDVGYSLLLAS